MTSTMRLMISLAILIVAFTYDAVAQERDLGLTFEDPLAWMFDPERHAVSDSHCDMPYHVVNFEADSAVLNPSPAGLASIVADLSVRLQSAPDSYVLVVGHSTVTEAAGLSAQRTHIVKQQVMDLSAQHRLAIDSWRIEERPMGPRCGREAERAHAVDLYIVPGVWYPDDALRRVCPGVE